MNCNKALRGIEHLRIDMFAVVPEYSSVYHYTSNMVRFNKVTILALGARSTYLEGRGTLVSHSLNQKPDGVSFYSFIRV